MQDPLLAQNDPNHALIHQTLKHAAIADGDKMNRAARHFHKRIDERHEDTLRSAAVKPGDEESNWRKGVRACFFWCHSVLLV